RTTSTCATIVSPKSVIRGSRTARAAIPSFGRLLVACPGLGARSGRCAGLEVSPPPRDDATTTTIAVTRATATRPKAGGSSRGLVGSRADHAPRAPELGPQEDLRGDVPAVARRHDDRVDVELAERVEQRRRSRDVHLAPRGDLLPAHPYRRDAP